MAVSRENGRIRLRRQLWRIFSQSKGRIDKQENTVAHRRGRPRGRTISTRGNRLGTG